MIQEGTIRQFSGPFDSNYTIDLGNSYYNNCKIGISVQEDDYMNWKLNLENNQNYQQTWTEYGKDIVFIINNEEIHLGKTFMYETEQQINNTTISFPNGAPSSLKVRVVYCIKNTLKEEEEDD